MENYNNQPPKYEDLSAPASSSGNTNTPELTKGKNLATISLVLGICGTVLSILFYLPGAILGLGAGIVGLILSMKSKTLGFVGGMRTAGFILSIIAMVLGTMMTVACVACWSSFNPYWYYYW